MFNIMPDLSEHLTTLDEAWQASMQVLIENPDIVKAKAPGCAPEQVDEAVKTVIKWAGSVRSPHGFRPIYPIARLQLAASIAILAEQAQNLKANPAGYFPAFLDKLLQTLAPITAASVFSDKTESQKGLAELGAELSQHIALMQTAQSELAEKIKALEAGELAADKIHEQAEKANASCQDIQQAVEKLGEQATEAEACLEAIKESESTIQENEKVVQALVAKNEALQAKIENQASALEALTQKAQEQHKLIDELLPSATSAGLARAFQIQRTRFGNSQAGWAAAFFASLVTLIVFSWQIKLGLPEGSSSEVWTYLLFRMPLAAPLVWLGWFSAIQYGNVLRLKEDYAFKEATSMAFAGYRDHMEHLHAVNDEQAGTALNQLSLTTIAILGNDPLRLLQQQTADASPWNRNSPETASGTEAKPR